MQSGRKDPPVATKAQLDNLFTFSQKLGDDYTGVFVDPATLVITIQNADNAVVTKDSIDVFTVILLDGGNLKNAAGTSLPSTDTSPLLTGNFGEKPGPAIVLVEAADPNVPVVTGFSDGDTITVTFSEDTNRPAITTKVDLDNLFTFSSSIGDNYVGTWASPSVLIITILDTGGIATPTPLTITVKQLGGLTNEAGTSLASISTFDTAFIDAEFGQKQAPLITSIKAVDPAPIDDAVFGNGDTITVRFSEATNGLTLPIPVATKAQLDDLFIFSENIGDDYSGEFINALTLVITIDDAVNLESPPQIGLLTLQVKNDAVELKDALESSLPSTSLSPPLTGTFGNKAGPSITSLVALDPFGRTAVFGNDDQIIVTFSEPTNEPPVFTKAELDDLFTFSQSLGTDYAGNFTDPITLVIRILDSDGGAPVVGTFRVRVNLDANLKDFTETSLASFVESPPLSGTFITKDGPTILSIVASDSEPIIDGFSDGEIPLP